MKLTGILFNHDQYSSATSALNVRLNAVAAARLPEWEEGDTYFSSVAAYAGDEVDLSALRIYARFEAPEAAGRTLEIATVAPQTVSIPAYIEDQLNALMFLNYPLYLILRSNLQQIYTLLDQSTSAVLGSLMPTQVQFDSAGRSGWVPFPVFGATIKTLGVGRHVVTWHWRYRPQGGTWRYLTTTQHKIYTVLRTPTPPWKQQPFTPANTQLPWIEALELATQWASGARKIANSSARITHAIFDLGGSLFTYGCPIGAISVYSNGPLLNLTMFLQRIAGGLGLGPYVNCSDCASFVSTLANLLGDTLWQGQMRDFQRGFPVNPIRAIGSEIISWPCNIGFFSYHEVAWSGEATENDLIYDSCLEVNTNPLPGPEQMVLPTGMRFGAESDGQYRDFLAAPFGRGLCRPQPELRTRRAVY